MILTKGFLCSPFFSSYQLNGLCGVLGKDEREAYLHYIMLLSQKPDPRRCKSYTLIKNVHVSGICLKIFIYIDFCTPLDMTLSSFCISFENMGYLYFSVSFLFSCFLACIFVLMLFGMHFFLMLLSMYIFF